MPEITVKIINRSRNPLPAYATAGSSGMDVMADVPGPLTLHPLERQLIPTGLFLEIPEGFEVQVRPRSGMAIKFGITCLNTPGTIDADYRGELRVILVNLSDTHHTIQPGDRIAQLVAVRVEKIKWQSADALGETARSQGGFGHTGL